jgi:hypothetical protein
VSLGTLVPNRTHPCRRSAIEATISRFSEGRTLVLHCESPEPPMSPLGHFRQIDQLPTFSACPLRSDRVRTFAPQRFDAMVESRMGAVAWAMRQRSVSHPRSSNRTCGFPASGSPTGFTVRHTKQSTDRKRHLRGVLSTQLSLKDLDHIGVCRLIAITFTLPSSKAYQKSGSFPPPALPGFNGHTTLSDSRRCRRPKRR